MNKLVQLSSREHYDIISSDFPDRKYHGVIEILKKEDMECPECQTKHPERFKVIVSINGKSKVFFVEDLQEAKTKAQALLLEGTS